MEHKIEEIIFWGDAIKRSDALIGGAVDDEDKEINLMNALKLFAPGTSIRTALDDIMRAKMGALIVLDKENLSNIVDGGFRINAKFSAQKLVELAKMDGAIIVSNDAKKILYANTLLSPNMKLKTRETGTRHKAAERTAKQFNTVVIAVSERKNKITLYFGEERYVLESSSEILRRATETLQILEKQKENFDDALLHLNVLEITNLATIMDICNILQKMEMIRREAEMVKRYLVELGKEGIIVSMRLKELTKDFIKERDLILRDYFGINSNKAEEVLCGMNFDFLLDTGNISRLLFEELHDKPISPEGLRILSKTNLLEKDVRAIIDNFRTLDKIFNSTRDDFVFVLKNETLADTFLENLEALREKILAGKRI
jgi:diadenylate cyclase